MGKRRKRRFEGLLHFTQANGRERGPEDTGDGPWQERTDMGHATHTKNKEEMRRREARRAKQARYEEE